MDPYLEDPARWRGVHARLIGVLGEMLTHQVAPRFFVDSEDDVYILNPDTSGRWQVEPDVYIVETVAREMPRRSRGRIAAPLLIEPPEPLEVRIPYLTVLDPSDQRVIATIEVLSPINKASGSKGQRAFRRKRADVIRSTAHWLEIDLLRAGARPAEVQGRGDYYALLHRAGAERFEVWPTRLREELPTVAVPLTSDLPDVPLDLQAAVETVYERFRYDAAIAYNAAPPMPPLSPDDAAWATERVRGVRRG